MSRPDAAVHMLDTRTCIYVMKNRTPRLNEWFNRLAAHLCMSSITLAELHFGVEKSERHADNLGILMEFAGRMETLAFSERAAAQYGRIRAGLERAGTPVGIHDLLIGAHARSEDLTLVTNNQREFDRMPGLRVENWVQ
jgi:tRNA(fMet)-specific endonuclease VapC